MLIDKNVKVKYQEGFFDKLFNRWHEIDVYRFVINTYHLNGVEPSRSILTVETQERNRYCAYRGFANVLAYSYPETYFDNDTTFLIDGKKYKVTKQNIDFINHNIEILKALEDL